MITVLVKVEDKLFEVCEACRGNGKEWIWKSSSNSPGSSSGSTTRKTCLSCNGNGLANHKEVKVITKKEFDKNRKGGAY